MQFKISCETFVFNNPKIYSFAILLFKNIEQDAESKRKP